MNTLAIDLLIVVYSLTNGIRVLSYFPQIARIAHDKTGAQAIALSTWSFWALANATTALYAWAVADDLLLSGISACNAACCVAVVTLVILKRRELGDRVRADALRPVAVRS
jgi:hypothetical protein